MPIQIKNAGEHNLKDVSVEFGDGLTVVTGVSGSGKTSLVFDTLYHEANRRFLEIFSLGSAGTRLSPAKVGIITGLGPAVAVGQNLLNRNPASTLASASGLHPLLRLLYARFGERHCPHCASPLSVLSGDEIVERLVALSAQGDLTVSVPLIQNVKGCHATLLKLLVAQFDPQAVWVDGAPWHKQPLDGTLPHTITLEIARFSTALSASQARQVVETAAGLGASTLQVSTPAGPLHLARSPVCVVCGAWFGDLEPVHFHTSCPHCDGKGCDACARTGLHPQAAAVTWNGMRLNELLALTVDQALSLFDLVSSDEAQNPPLPPLEKRGVREELRQFLPPFFQGGAGGDSVATPILASTRSALRVGAGGEVLPPRLRDEIERRLSALQSVGLGYIALNRPSPTLSRGEAQRVRIAVALTSRLEDMLHVLDEPTIGQHPADVARLLPVLRRLAGPVIYVEHDRSAAAEADQAIDIGPGAGSAGGQVIYTGTPAGLWQADTPTGRYFSQRQAVPIPAPRPRPDQFLIVRGAALRNLRDIDLTFPLGRMTVITGVSGSGKSTLIEEVLLPSLLQLKPVGCRAIEGPAITPILVDQDPIGQNPRSNPATYTKLADLIRDCFAAASGLSPSHFSFNRPEGACPTCQGMGAQEVRMSYLPPTWIPCPDCDGQRFSDEVLAARVDFGGRWLSIADFYALSIREAAPLLLENASLPPSRRRAARQILEALIDTGLGYLELGQPSPTLSGGEAQRVKLAKFLGKNSLSDHLLILDEPSTGLHPQDISGLLIILDRLARSGATIVVVEHSTDVMRAADWILDLGPGAGPDGGQLIYAGPPAGLLTAEGSLTGQALRQESALQPRAAGSGAAHPRPAHIAIRNARANNLTGVDVDFPKGALTVVTGVSGSGKSSLVGDVLEAEARRRFLETLSMYERQGTREGPEAAVDAVSGLGVAVTLTGERRVYERRATLGTATEIAHHLAILLASFGERPCPNCAQPLQRRATWICPNCAYTAPLPQPRHFNPWVYGAACTTCHGVGTLQIPCPEKLIIHPEKPLIAGAMYSPGFFPNGYLGKPYNGGNDLLLALGARFGFDPATTPWNELSQEIQSVFLYGDDQPMEVIVHSRAQGTFTRTATFPGFYGWIRDWDVGGTYTHTATCPDCAGSALRPAYASVTLGGYTSYQLSETPLAELLPVLRAFNSPVIAAHLAAASLNTALRRIEFLLRVGLGYLHLNRISATLSAGEAQRVRLAGLLGSGLTALTVLLDEPTRGLHPREIDALLSALFELRDEGNTLIVVEHDLNFMRAADYLVDVGPGPGLAGGQIVARGTPAQVAQAETLTAAWLRGEKRGGTALRVGAKISIGQRIPPSPPFERGARIRDAALLLPPFRRGGRGGFSALPIFSLQQRNRRAPNAWLTLRGARANNLRSETVRFPLGVLVGICGVSGSGKSTLVIDTLARALAPHKHSTSVAQEPFEPGPHDAIEGAPARVILVDQVKTGLETPSAFLGLDPLLRALFAASEEGVALGLDESAFHRGCSACNGRGSLKTELEFLPALYTPCEVCRGSGLRPEAWDVHVGGLSLPELYALPIERAFELFCHNPALAAPLTAARQVGLGYLVLHQPGHTLSGGEAQRLKIARELCQKTQPASLYILDEPTVGQHLEDVARLNAVLHHLVAAGHSVFVVEHHPHLLAACDWLIELGPGGGPQGGRVIASGTPEDLAKMDTPIGPYLKEVLG